jgi:hypothetical protein
MRIGVGLGLFLSLRGGAGEAPVLLPLTLARADIFLDRVDLTIASAEA